MSQPEAPDPFEAGLSVDVRATAIRATERVPGLKFITIAMAVCNLLALLTPWAPRAGWLSVLMQLPFIVVGYVVVWYFWKGRRWARTLVVATSVLALLNALAFPWVGLVMRVVIVVELALAIYILFWLRSPTSRAHFASPPPRVVRHGKKSRQRS